MKSIKFGIVAIITLLIWSCSQNRHESPAMEMAEVEYDMVAPTEESISGNSTHSPETYISSSAALENPNDTTRRMIRTADIKFKVKDVIKTTYNIENIVVKHNGFVERTNLASQTNYTKETTIKEDSILLTTYYTVINTLVLRVPNTQLDTTLKEIAQFVEFMDYRNISARDVTLDLLAKRLEQSRLANCIFENGLKIRYHLPYSFVEIGHNDENIREFSLLVMRQYLDFIHSLQGTFAVIHIGYYDNCLLQNCLTSLQKTAACAKQLGITLCIENLMQGITTNIDYLFELLTVDNVYMCLDTGHANVVNRSNENYIPQLLTVLDKVKHSHIYFSEDSNFNHIPFCEETLYNSQIMYALAKSPCDWFSMELDNFEEQKQQESILKLFFNQYSI